VSLTVAAAVANCGNKAYTVAMLTDPTIKAALLEEIRFAKRQQWTITAAVVGLIGGAYSIAHSIEQSQWLQAYTGSSIFTDISTAHDCASIHTILIRGGEGRRLSMEWQAL